MFQGNFFFSGYFAPHYFPGSEHMTVELAADFVVGCVNEWEV